MKSAAIIALLCLAAACGETATKDGSGSNTDTDAGSDTGGETTPTEFEYLLPESNVEVLSDGEIADVRIGACSLVNGEFVGIVEATSVSERIPDVCTGETRRIHRVVEFEVVDTFSGEAASGAYITTLSVDTPMQPGDQIVVNLIGLPDGEFAASTELRVIPLGDPIPNGFIDATPGHVDLPANLDELTAAVERATAGDCNPGTIPPTNPDQVATFYTTPNEAACPM